MGPVEPPQRQHCAMGIPGSKTALEELMCRVLGELFQERSVANIAYYLYCGNNTPHELLVNWRKVLSALGRFNLRLSTEKTVTCPASTTILGFFRSCRKSLASNRSIALLRISSGS